MSIYAHMPPVEIPYMVKQSAVTNDNDLEQLTAMFRLLSDKTRLNILMLLAGGERNVSSLCDELRLPQPTVSHHLGLLRMNNVIANRRAGKQVFYGLNHKVDASEASLMIEVQRYDLKIVRKAHIPDNGAAGLES